MIQTIGLHDCAAIGTIENAQCAERLLLSPTTAPRRCSDRTDSYLLRRGSTHGKLTGIAMAVACRVVLGE